MTLHVKLWFLVKTLSTPQKVACFFTIIGNIYVRTSSAAIDKQFSDYEIDCIAQNEIGIYKYWSVMQIIMNTV